MAEKIKLFVNSREVEVEAGKNLIDAVAAIGIEIPHICYHPALGADGNCRMCLVEIEDGRPPLVPACKTRAVEGMKVRLDTEKIQKIQRDIMEFELINHPIDCPICDQAGECILQDYYMRYDGAKSRMTVPQLTKRKKIDFGAGVIHDQERCVLCARCVRFTRLITKTGELGIVNRADNARVMIFPGRPLANRYALNVVDLCPVGAMTSKDFRFRQRAWFLTKSESICHGCSKGCNIFIDHNKEKYEDDIIYRYRPRFNSLVNGYFMCDAGRMTYKKENDQRLTQAMIDKKQVRFELVYENLRRLIQQAKKIVFLISPQCSLEQMYAIQHFGKSINATISGYSDGYIQQGDGDGYLIQDDKSANRAAFLLLQIPSDKAHFQTSLTGCDLLISWDNNLTLSMNEDALTAVKINKKIIYIGSYSNPFAETADIIIPVASYSEEYGCIINIDNILQCYKQAVFKNQSMPRMIEVIDYLGGALSNRKEIWLDAVRTIESLKGIELDTIPSQGIALTPNEVSNVVA